MTQDELKALVGQAALEHVVTDSVVGVGTGSTVNCFIDALATIKDRIRGAVSSSVKSSERLQAHGIPVLDAALRPQALRRRVLQLGDGIEGELVRVFGIEPEEEGAGEGVGNQGHVRKIVSQRPSIIAAQE